MPEKFFDDNKRRDALLYMQGYANKGIRDDMKYIDKEDYKKPYAEAIEYAAGMAPGDQLLKELLMRLFREENMPGYKPKTDSVSVANKITDNP